MGRKFNYTYHEEENIIRRHRSTFKHSSFLFNFKTYINHHILFANIRMKSLYIIEFFCRARDAIIILFYLLVINGQKLCLRLSYRDKHLSACASTTKSLSCLDGFQRLIIHNNVIWVCVQAWETRMCYWCSMTVVWFVQFCRHKIKSFLGIKPICF